MFLNFSERKCNNFIESIVTMEPSDANSLTIHDSRIYPGTENLYFIIAMNLIIVVAAIFSLFGNGCTCLVIYRYKAMRTSTNIYIFNLAFIDFIISMLFPLDIFALWYPDYYPLGSIGCAIHYVLWELLSNGSVMTISVFSVERYLVITKPFLRQTLCSKSRVAKIIIAIWVLSVLFSVPNMSFKYKVKQFCYIDLSGGEDILIKTQAILFFVVPGIMMAVLYTLMALKLRAKSIENVNNPTQNRDKAAKMLGAVAAMFFIYWSPYCFFRFLISDKSHTLFGWWGLFNASAMVVIYFSACMNPVLYYMMSKRFRRSFKNLIEGGNENLSRMDTNNTLF